VEKVWGGREFETKLGMKLPEGKKIGESWEVSAHPHGMGIVENGALAGQRLDDIYKEYKGELTGKKVYEIEVMDGNIEKDYEIDAETGAILKMEQEQKGNKKNNSVDNPKISSDKAKEIALKQSKNGKFKEIELKHKNGVLVYDVEIAEGFMDREFLIDANTGEILRDKKDF